VLLFPGFDANHVKVAVNPVNGADVPRRIDRELRSGRGAIFSTALQIAGKEWLSVEPLQPNHPCSPDRASDLHGIRSAVAAQLFEGAVGYSFESAFKAIRR